MSIREKIQKVSDDVCYSIGKTVNDALEYEGKYNKLIGGAEYVFGKAGSFACKSIHRAQGPIGHYINKKLEMDPIGDCQADFEYFARVGKEKMTKK